MQTRRDYLVSLDLAKPGRGKFSTVAKEALDKARSEGVKFSDDDGPVPVQPKPETGESPKPVYNPGNSPYLTDSEYRFPESDYKGIAVSTNKEVSLRECCNTCRVSLLNHSCDAPFIHGNVEVRIVQKRVVNAST